MTMQAIDETLEFPELAEDVEELATSALESAEDRLEAYGEIVPFLYMVEGDTLVVETFPAHDTVEGLDQAYAKLADSDKYSAYVLAYEGVVDVEDEEGEDEVDAIVIEVGVAGEDKSVVFCEPFTMDVEYLEFDEEGCIFLGTEDNPIADVEGLEFKLPENLQERDEA